MTEFKVLLIVGIVVVATLGGGWLVGNNRPVEQSQYRGVTNYDTVSVTDGFQVDGTTVIDGSGNIDAPITSTTGTFSSTLDVTGETSVQGFTQGGGCRASTTVAATETLTEAQLLANNCFEYNGANAAAITITLPATSTMTTLLPNAGDFREWMIDNAYTAAATTTTIAAGTGIDLIAVTANDDVQDGTEFARLTCYRKTNTDVACIISELLAAD